MPQTYNYKMSKLTLLLIHKLGILHACPMPQIREDR